MLSAKTSARESARASAGKPARESARASAGELARESARASTKTSSDAKSLLLPSHLPKSLAGHLKHLIKRLLKRNNRLYALFSVSFIIAACILILVVAMSLLGPLIAPYDPDLTNLREKYLTASSTHFLGTDNLGRDVFSRLLLGGQTCILTALFCVGVSVVVGIPLGLLSGYQGGKLDFIVMRAYDIMLSFPSLLMAFIFVAAFGRSAWMAALAIGISYIPMISRVTRSLVMVEKEKTYVEAARSLGYSPLRILFLEILPNCTSTILAELALDFGYAIVAISSLSYLGLGVQPPAADWGCMMQEGMVALQKQPLIVLAPGVSIVATVISLNIINDCVQSWLES
ncbi:MAG: ABC transporter permease [Coriobacteriales bacterium]|jgi:peptide/nickel transport system permease protein|nr:ABC transporter permease [Coriobacteriales bacterium]